MISNKGSKRIVEIDDNDFERGEVMIRVKRKMVKKQ